MIYNIENPSLPQFRFEWHPEKKNVYIIRVGVVPEVGEIVAFDIATQGDAINAVMIWSRGYQERARELRRSNGGAPVEIVPRRDGVELAKRGLVQ